MAIEGSLFYKLTMPHFSMKITADKEGIMLTVGDQIYSLTYPEYRMVSEVMHDALRVEYHVLGETTDA